MPFNTVFVWTAITPPLPSEFLQVSCVTMQRYRWLRDTLSVVAFICEALRFLTAERIGDDDDVTSCQP